MSKPNIHYNKVDDPQVAAYLANVLLKTYDPVNVQEQIEAVQAVDLYHFGFLTHHRKNGWNPSWVVWENDDIVFIGITGTTTSSQGNEQSISWSTPGTPMPYGTAADIYAVVSNRIVEQLQNEGRVGYLRQYHVFGHSYGGALAICVALRLRSIYSRSQISCSTFGNPSPGYSDLAQAAARELRLMRWINQGDMISWLPPVSSQAPAAFFAALPLSRLYWTKYVQPSTGLILTSAGTTIPGTIAFQTKLINDGTILAWAAGASGELSSEHALPTYISRLLRVEQRLEKIEQEVVVPPSPVAPEAAAVTLDSIKPVVPAHRRRRRR